MRSIESIQKGYENIRNTSSRNTDEKRMRYDFHRLVDSTWSLKNAIEIFAEKKHHLGNMMQHDLFKLIIVCSRYLNEDIRTQKLDIDFLDCWNLFSDILDKMFLKGERLNNELVLSLGRILFITALIFDMPETSNIGNIVSNPDARRLSGTFPASISDIEFSKTLPGELMGPFKSVSDVLINLKKNLHFYLDKIRN